MTSIFGIKTNLGDEAIVLAADTKMTSDDDNVSFLNSPGESKIYVGDCFTLAISGVGNDCVNSFVSYLNGEIDYISFRNFIKKGNEIGKGISSLEQKVLRNRDEHPLERAVHTGDFREFLILNKYLLEEERGDNDCVCEMILATQNNMGLYFVDVLGTVYPASDYPGLEYWTGGSGGEFMNKYLEEMDIDGHISDPTLPRRVDLNKIDKESAVLLSRKCIQEGIRKDKNSGGKEDYVIMTPEEIVHWGDILKKVEKQGYDKIFKSMIS